MKTISQLLKRVVLTTLISLISVQLNAQTVTSTYYHTDALGSIVAASDEQGDIIWKKTYDLTFSSFCGRGLSTNQQLANSQRFQFVAGTVIAGETALVGAMVTPGLAVAGGEGALLIGSRFPTATAVATDLTLGEVGMVGGTTAIAAKGLKNTGPLKNASGSLDDAANAARTQSFGGGLSVQFVSNANQVSHAFRHTDKVGLSRGSVQSAISRDLSQNGHLLRTGSNTRNINVGGIDLTFNAHRLSNGAVNVGRITPPRP